MCIKKDAFAVERGERDMEFRPCIDIHDGKVKQIVGGSLKEKNGGGSQVEENFVSAQDAAFYAALYKKLGIRGGHIILLNPPESIYYEVTKEQALNALREYPGGLQIGGGICPSNAEFFLKAGASHVIVTSYVFRNGKIDFEKLEKLKQCTGKERLVLDMSCKKKEEGYVVVTDRWQKETSQYITEALLNELSGYCDEFLIHAVDVEGKAQGIEKELVSLLGKWGKKKVTYAGGVHSFEDLSLLKQLGQDRVHVTIGSALHLFGGRLNLYDVLDFIKKE